MSANQLALWYLVAAVSFILALKGLSSPATDQRVNIDLAKETGMVRPELAVLLAGGDPDRTEAAPQWRRVF